MHHLFMPQSQLKNGGRQLRITGDDYHHIVRVLRMKTGDELSVSVTDVENGDAAAEYRYGIDAITEREVVCTLRFIKEEDRELPAKISLLQCLPKGDKMEQIIQKAVELGVYEVIPVSARRCVVRLDETKAKTKVARWRKIAEAAAMQSKRGIIPEIREVMTVDEALSYASDCDLKLIPYELSAVKEDAEGGIAKTKHLIGSIREGWRIAVMIGPEGGFDEAEVARALDAGFEDVSLGRRILRTETAGPAVLAWMMFHLEE
ncbi:MAG: 16S rRNA (uracil(1498)-N(3))-methyltransferase [Lachnospiraceae bacterium]|nr:16S rRNA (uracil(1498)-N(3))-methyltransferase [Lachnospiraceae bacterium]